MVLCSAVYRGEMNLLVCAVNIKPTVMNNCNIELILWCDLLR